MTYTYTHTHTQPPPLPPPHTLPLTHTHALTAGLGEHRVRELNDEINKLNKTKAHWDSRIVELGGGDQTKGRKFYDVEGTYMLDVTCS